LFGAPEDGGDVVAQLALGDDRHTRERSRTATQVQTSAVKDEHPIAFPTSHDVGKAIEGLGTTPES
jgi:hypothetical protein